MKRFRNHMTQYERWITSHEEDHFVTVRENIEQVISGMSCGESYNPSSRILESWILGPILHTPYFGLISFIHLGFSVDIQHCFNRIQSNIPTPDCNVNLFLFNLDEHIHAEEYDNEDDAPEEEYTKAELAVLAELSMIAQR